MEWPVRDAKGEIPSPRLTADVPVSVTDSEQAPMTHRGQRKTKSGKPRPARR